MFKRPRRETVLTPDEILSKMEHYCAYRERSPFEAQQKLKSLGAAGEVADQIYSVLEADGYINAERFAFAFAGGKFRVNRWGKNKIRIGLRQHRIPDRLIEEALDTIDQNNYITTLRQLIENKQNQLGEDPNRRQKTVAYLTNAGFEAELIFTYL